MATQPHSIEIEILPNGRIKGEVKGVTGKSCSAITEWLDKLGKVEVDKHTSDYFKTGDQNLTVKR